MTLYLARKLCFETNQGLCFKFCWKTKMKFWSDYALIFFFQNNFSRTSTPQNAAIYDQNVVLEFAAAVQYKLLCKAKLYFRWETCSSESFPQQICTLSIVHSLRGTPSGALYWALTWALPKALSTSLQLFIKLSFKLSLKLSSNLPYKLS